MSRSCAEAPSSYCETNLKVLAHQHVKDKKLRGKLKSYESQHQQAAIQAARSEILLTEQPGYERTLAVTLMHHYVVKQDYYGRKRGLVVQFHVLIRILKQFVFGQVVFSSKIYKHDICMVRILNTRWRHSSAGCLVVMLFIMFV